ncbi:hypothetical protein MWU61_13955 [Loktanella sp. F6476L]|uniref:hypothetical protein n=1 Tax=Loktanella sp. F6476L TaxID=2926405 RepID=UPI001FF2C8B0|nr:hypothetical protein [Loktanella sp. F6476L]MCK0121652.1 hypothetical protein [Loktanella sp. F6476L]
MKKQDNPDPDREEAARLRISQIADLFSEMRILLARWLDEAGPAADASTKQMMTKINELQSTHLMVLRAEEVFHEKYGSPDADTGIDYDDARDTIGRELDRLRASIGPKDVSGKPDAGSD